jgi:hypothetical protein
VDNGNIERSFSVFSKVVHVYMLAHRAGKREEII